MGSGYYVAAAHPPDMDRRSEDDIAREIVARSPRAWARPACARASSARSATRGRGRTTRRRWCARRWQAQRETGAPLMIHPGRARAAPMQIVELIGKEGADLDADDHVPHRAHDRRPAVLLELAATGVWLEYDLFGLETSYYPYNPDLRHAQRRRADAPDPLPDRARAPAPRSSCPTTSPTSTASRSGAASAITTSSST